MQIYDFIFKIQNLVHKLRTKTKDKNKIAGINKDENEDENENCHAGHERELTKLKT